MKKIDNILKNKSSYDIYRSSYVCFVAQVILDQIFEKNNIHVLSLKGKNLNLKSANNFLATEIIFQKDEIIKQINTKIGTSVVEKIKVF